MLIQMLIISLLSNLLSGSRRMFPVIHGLSVLLAMRAMRSSSNLSIYDLRRAASETASAFFDQKIFENIRRMGKKSW
jgi:hypothetical protein